MKLLKENHVERPSGKNNRADSNSTTGYHESHINSSSSQIQDRPIVEIKKGMVITNSLDVAKKFGKRHDAVLRDIRNLDCSDRFILHSFVERKYLDGRSKMQPMYEITKDGFTFLVMGFRGKKAAQWKEKYINAFNAMERVLLHQANTAWQELRDQGKTTRLEATDTIQTFIDYATRQGSQNAKYYYPNITNATYKALFIITYKSSSNFRNLLDNMQLSFLQTAEYVAINAINDGMRSNLHYKEIFKLCKSRLQAFAENVGVTPVINDTPKMQLASNA